MANENFNILVERAMHASELSHMRPVIEKELLHYDILFALDDKNLLDNITFQGGTALRLCYGGQRFSEDLDFAGGINFQTADLMNMKRCIESYIGERYGLEVMVKEPKDMQAEDERHGIKIDKWQIRMITAPERPDIPQQMIKIEVASVPAYTGIAKALKTNYEFLPDGYSDILVITESLDEIMADKIIAFPTCQRYIRYRDIWDLQWLQKQGALINIDLVQKKIADYKITDYLSNLEKTIKHLPEIIHSNAFKAQMTRFIPLSVQEKTLNREKFYTFLDNEITDIFQYVHSNLP